MKWFCLTFLTARIVLYSSLRWPHKEQWLTKRRLPIYADWMNAWIDKMDVLKMSCIILLIESQKRQKYSMSPICQYPERPPMGRAGISAQLKTIAFNQWDFSTLNVKRWTFLSLSINSLWTWFTHNRSSCGYKSLLNQIRFVG